MTKCPVKEEHTYELNRELAGLHYLAYHVGAGRQDTREVREKLTKTRRKCIEVCRDVKNSMADDFQPESHEFSADENRRLISVCIALKLLAKELKILQRLASEFPEKSVKSLFHPATFMFLDGAAAYMMDGAGTSGASAESIQIFRERKEVVELLQVLSRGLKTTNSMEAEDAENEEIFTDTEKKKFLKSRMCGVQNIFCCRRKVTYL